jgi:hypothetical protein
MIIANRPASHSFSTDPVAHDVRTFVAPSARLSTARTDREILSCADSRGDFARLYPSLFADEGPASVHWQVARAAAVALRATGSAAAAFLAIILK